MPVIAMPDETQGSRRRWRRIPVLKSGVLSLDGESRTVECEVRDVTQGGARIRAASLPDGAETFDLRIGDGESHHCRTIWHDREIMGVEYVDTPGAAPAGSERDGEPGRNDGPRDRMLRPGQIVFHDGQCIMECTILDLSKTGALVQPQDILICPDLFELRVKFGPTFHCKVIRHTGTTLGIQFLD